jgi:Protein of unknown function (DUF2844)
MKSILALLLAASSATAFAALGGAPQALGPRVLASKASAMATGLSTYTDVARTLDSCTSAGTVFAVSWQGPYKPDLREVLGAHFQGMVDAAKRQPGGARAPMRLERDDLVIYSGGRTGAFEGRAWIPALLPAGFDTSAIK